MLVNNKANYHIKKNPLVGTTFTGRNLSLPAGSSITQNRDSLQGQGLTSVVSNDLEMIMDPS